MLNHAFWNIALTKLLQSSVFFEETLTVHSSLLFGTKTKGMAYAQLNWNVKKQ